MVNHRVMLLLAMATAGCAALPEQPIPQDSPAMHSSNETQASQEAEEADASASDGPGPQQITPKHENFELKGSGQFVREGSQAASSASPVENGITLNFVDMDIRTALTSVLGEALGVPYTVDPSVSGNLTLQSEQPLSKEDALRALEVALSLQNIAIVDGPGGYAVVPKTTAQNQVNELRTASSASRPGYGVLAMPLQYVGAKELEQLLRSIAPQGHVLATDEARNLILLSGNSAELSSLRGIVKQLDVDWLSGMSFALYPVKYVEAKVIVDELKTTLLDKDSPISSIVRLVPLNRLNAILVASPSSAYLDKIHSWIDKLDVGGSSAGRRIFVYDVQNERAEDLADALREVFGLGSGQGNYGNATTANAGTGATLAAYSNPQRPQEDGEVASLAAGNGAGLESLGIRIVPNAGSNSILILATPEEFRVIETALKRMDRPSLQVLIEATLAEVTLNDSLRYGVQWEFLQDGNIATLSQGDNGGVGQSFPGFSYLHTGGNFIAALNALDSITDVQVISSPRLMILNNQEATISVGDQVPILTQQAVNADNDDARVVNSVSQRDTGVILRVQPRANSSGAVTLDISQEVSSVVPTTTSGIDSPTIQERQISSTISVRDGESVVLGGLISESQSSGKSGVPFLARIPVLGWLFGATTVSNQKTELIVFIRPRIVRDNLEMRALTEDLRTEFSKTVHNMEARTP